MKPNQAVAGKDQIFQPSPVYWAGASLKRLHR